MNVFPIHNDMDHKKAMNRVDALMEANDGTGPKVGSQEGDELEVLALLVERYEEERFPLDLPTPVEAVKFAMEQMELGQTDLSQILGSRSRASELLNGNLKGLSRRMMQTLHTKLHIPADILIRDC